MSMGVIVTKLFVPARRGGLVGRPWLVERLDAAVDAGHRLTLVSAPAGFGKTTLVAGWAAQRDDVGWLSLDEEDNAFPRFLAHLWAALPGIRAAPPGAGVSTTAALTAVVNEYATRPDGPAVLVLDDYHVIESLEVHEAVAFLLDNLPEQLHLVISTRADPPFPLARLRSRGQLTELRVDDLRFGPAEAHVFLTDVMGLQLTENVVLALEERTEGWAAGLQLAALSLRGAADIEGFVDAFTGSHRFVIDYLADEVLERKPAQVRDFLLGTAILDRLTGSLCDAVTGQGNGTEQLVELDRGNVFLIPLDADRTWYRYHHLFRDVLRARLLTEHPDQLRHLHRAASDWYAAHNLIPEAVRHAVSAGDHERAARLIEEALPAVRRARQDALLLEWIGSLPDSVRRRNPVLSVVSAWASMMSGDLDAMERRLDDADAALAAAASDPASAASWADTEDLRTAPAMIPVYRAALAQARGQVEETVRHARRALELAGPDDHFVRGAAGGFVALAAWAAGDVEQALATYTIAVRELHAAGNLVDEQDSTIVLGDLLVAAGRPAEARQTFEAALAAATRNGAPYPRVTADLHVGLAGLDRELGDLAAAEAHLESARVLAEHGSITENRHRWYVEFAQVSAARGNLSEAFRLLAEADIVYRPGSYPEVRPIAAVRARIHIEAGELTAAETWERDVPKTLSYMNEYNQLTRVRLMVRRGDSPSDVNELLDQLQADAASRPGSLREIEQLRMLALHPGTRPRSAAPDGQGDALTERELDVLRLLDTELTGPEIARHLYLSLNTVRTHTKRIFTKLGATTRTAAVRRAHERGLL